MKLQSILAIALPVFLFSCGGGNTTESSNTEESTETTETTEEVVEAPEAKVVDAVCIWDKVSVRATPDPKGKWLTSMSIGEKVTFLGETQVDSVDKKTYYKVKLADDTEGWSRSEFVIPEGTVAVFLKDTEIYKRPDLLTKAEKQYSQMDIVAVKSTQDDWLEVTGKRAEGKWIEKGWVKSGNISQDQIDVAVAKFGTQALAQEDDDKKMEALQEILDNGDLASSQFIPVLAQIVSEMNSVEELPAIENDSVQ
ncbi:MAG: SH3 domain-containing protein [bacterium]|nr:SH3 domain-containing protein [bacterium]